jgi:hypothetical protein
MRHFGSRYEERSTTILPGPLQEGQRLALISLHKVQVLGVVPARLRGLQAALPASRELSN